MPKLIPAVACGAALSAVLALGWGIHLSGENKRLGAANTALAADLAAEQSLRAAEHQVAVRQAQRVATLTTKQREQHATLSTSLRAEPSWAAEPVPDSIADALGLPVSATDGKPAE